MCDPHLWENVPKVQVAPLKSLTNHHTCGRERPTRKHTGTDAELNTLTPYVKLNPGSPWDVPLRYNYIHMKISNYVRTGPSQIVAQ